MNVSILKCIAVDACMYLSVVFLVWWRFLRAPHISFKVSAMYLCQVNLAGFSGSNVNFRATSVTKAGLYVLSCLSWLNQAILYIS